MLAHHPSISSSSALTSPRSSFVDQIPNNDLSQKKTPSLSKYSTASSEDASVGQPSRKRFSQRTKRRSLSTKTKVNRISLHPPTSRSKVHNVNNNAFDEREEVSLEVNSPPPGLGSERHLQKKDSEVGGETYNKFLTALLQDDYDTLDEILSNHKSETNVNVNGTLQISNEHDTSITFLMYAAWFGFEDSLSALISHGADVNIRTAGRGFTALHFGVLGNHLETCEILIRNGALLNVKDKLYGTTPVELALSLQTEKHTKEMVDLLLIYNEWKVKQLIDSEDDRLVDLEEDWHNSRHADEIIFMNQKDFRGIPMIALSYINQNYDVSSLVLHLLEKYSFSASADVKFHPNAVEVNEADSQGYTVLDHAIRFGDMNAIVKLGKVGAKSGKVEDVFKLATTIYPDNPEKDPLMCLILCLNHLEQSQQILKLSFQGLNDMTNPLHYLCSITYKAEERGEKPGHRPSFERLDIETRSEVNNVVADFLELHNLMDFNTETGDIQLYAQIAKFFIEYFSLDINAMSLVGDTALHLACENGNKELAVFLLKNKALVDIPNGEGWYPIHLAVKSCDYDLVELFVKYLVSFNFSEFPTTKDKFHLNAMKKLYISKRSKNNRGVTPFVIACGLKPHTERESKVSEEAKELFDDECLKIVHLIAKGSSNIMKPCKGTNFNCLHAAALQGNIKIMKFLLKKLRNEYSFFDHMDQKLRLRDVLGLHVTSNGYTPLHYAAENGDLSMCKMLVLFNANVNVIDANAKRPIDLAYEGGHDLIVKYLSEFCDVDTGLKPLKDPMLNMNINKSFTLTTRSKSTLNDKSRRGKGVQGIQEHQAKQLKKLLRNDRERQFVPYNVRL